MANLIVHSLNINGFRSTLKQRYIQQYVQSQQIDILNIQETFVDNYFLSKKIELMLDLRKRCIWSYGSDNSRGVVTLFINTSIEIEHFHADFDGRLVYVDFTYNESKYRIVNVYAPNQSQDRNTYLDRLTPYLVTARHLILNGDFNFVLDSKLDKVGGNLNKGTVGSKIFKNIIDKHKLIDAFRYLHPNKRAVTWMSKYASNSKHDYEYIGNRLDRFYVCNTLSNSILNSDITPCAVSDHNFITLTLNTNQGISFGKSYWKFNDSLLEDKEFVDLFEYYWQIISRTNNITLEWWDCIKLKIKEFCIDYSKSKNREIYGEYKELRRQYQALNEGDLKQLEEIKLKLKDIEIELQKGSILRSKAKIIDNNENPTCYFFNKEKTASLRKTITSIKTDGDNFTSSESILDCFKTFYTDLYTDEPVDDSLNDMFLADLPKVSASDNADLCEDISKEEIWNNLRSMKLDKSPGSDGLTTAFYKKFFHLLGDTLESLFQICYDSGEMSQSQKLSYITLLCKDKKNADDMKNYRPISLLNIDRKILSKIISTRLSYILPSIIGISQTCSIRGRSIFDNLHLFRNIQDYIEQKDLYAAFISLDQEKAFDRVSWSYLYNTLKAFGFHDNFIHWISVLYADVRSSVIVNNHISTPFEIKRGVRQGCSLSPLLYVLCLEPFAKKVQDDNEIHGIKVPGSDYEIKMSLYADDNTGIFTSDFSMHKYFYHIKCFQKISGSKINYRKSNGMYLGKWKNRSDHPFGITWVPNAKLLGYRYGYNINEDDMWSKLYLKFDNTMNLWRNRQLSFKGKSIVLNSICINEILYYVSAGIIPSHYRTLFQRSCFRFIWASTYEPVGRNTLYLPFREGGLNVPYIKLKIEAIYMSHLISLIKNRSASWTYFAKYWIGLHLKKENKILGSNLIPHSEIIPPFYTICLTVYKKFRDLYPDMLIDQLKTKEIYRLLISSLEIKPKVLRNFPSVNFKQVFKNIYSPFIDLNVRNLIWRISHDVLYVNYFLLSKGIGNTKLCPFCNKIETVSHLLLQCEMVTPLNKIVLKLLRAVSDNRIKFSEKTFRFIQLPPLEDRVYNIALILLSESRYAIWTCRNKAHHESVKFTQYSLALKFLSRIRYRIRVDLLRMKFAQFVTFWSEFISVPSAGVIEIDKCLNIDTYFKLVDSS